MENKTTLDWEKFKPLFGNWDSKIYPFFQSGGLDNIYKYLKKEGSRGKKILPASEDVFRCFKETDVNNLKLVICGFAPYHTMKDNIIIADGLAMSCSHTNYLQPSLAQWYNEVERTLYNGLNLNEYKTPDLKFLAHQGVLLLNSSLTTTFLHPGDHCSLWEPFMKFIFEEIINNTGVPVIFLGREAAKLEKYTAPFTWIFKISHPASASYNGDSWDSDNIFNKINKILSDTNGYKIDWLDFPEDDNDLPF